MGATGITTIDFGAFPGKSDTSTTITGQTGIVAGSLVETWIRPVATADHSADEHMVETLNVFAHSIVAGVGFTISGFNTTQLNEPLQLAGTAGGFRTAQDAEYGTSSPSVGGRGTRLYGLFSVCWVWI